MNRKLYRWYKELPIAKWKHENLLENLLGMWADCSEIGKRFYVLYYYLTDHKYYINGLKHIDAAIMLFTKSYSQSSYKQLYNKSKSQLMRDMIYSLHRFGASFNDYFWFKFYNLSATGRAQFVTDKLRHTYIDQFNNRNNKDIFDNKIKTYETFKKYYKRDICPIQSIENEDALKQMLKKHEKVLLKPLSANCGKGVKVYYSDELKQIGIKGILSIYRDGCVVEELLTQNNILGEVHPKSLNTIRLATVKVGNVVEYFPFIRFGRNENVVDNAGAGGLFSKIDPETGIVQSAADEYGNHYLIHPETKKQIIGMIIPKWKEVKELANELMAIIPDNHSVGWDFAFVNDQWLLIEANYCGEFIGQVSSGIGDRPRLEKMIELLK